MKRFSVLAIYKKETNGTFKIVNCTFRENKNGCIFNFNSCFRKQYKDFQTLYNAILETVKNNNGYVKNWNNYGTTFYDIMFVNIDCPETTEHYSYKIY